MDYDNLDDVLADVEIPTQNHKTTKTQKQRPIKILVSEDVYARIASKAEALGAPVAVACKMQVMAWLNGAAVIGAPVSQQHETITPPKPRGRPAMSEEERLAAEKEREYKARQEKKYREWLKSPLYWQVMENRQSEMFGDPVFTLPDGTRPEFPNPMTPEARKEILREKWIYEDLLAGHAQTREESNYQFEAYSKGRDWNRPRDGV